jgi:hypothetical protein
VLREACFEFRRTFIEGSHQAFTRRKHFENFPGKLQVYPMTHFVHAWKIDPEKLVVTLRDDTYSPSLVPDKTQIPFVD